MSGVRIASRTPIRPASPVGDCIAVRLGGDEPAAD